MGIENIKAFLTFLIRVVNELIDLDSNQDGRISFSEALSLATTLSFQFPKVQKAFPLIDDEYRDLDQAELAELVDWFIENFDLDLESDRVELLIREAVRTLHMNYQSYLNIKLILGQ